MKFYAKMYIRRLFNDLETVNEIELPDNLKRHLVSAIAGEKICFIKHIMTLIEPYTKNELLFINTPYSVMYNYLGEETFKIIMMVGPQQQIYFERYEVLDANLVETEIYYEGDRPYMRNHLKFASFRTLASEPLCWIIHTNDPGESKYPALNRELIGSGHDMSMPVILAYECDSDVDKRLSEMVK